MSNLIICLLRGMLLLISSTAPACATPGKLMRNSKDNYDKP